MDLEKARRQHLEKYGSMMFCPKKETLCFFMDGMWMTGCERQICILEDPEYLDLKQRQKRNQAKNEKRAREERKREAENPPAPIRTQRKYPEDLLMEKIQKLEEESREAYRRNKPRVGESKLHEAIVLRRKQLQK